MPASQAKEITAKLRILGASLEGELFHDDMMRSLYATDASVYRELPLAVAMPRHEDDLRQLVHFARNEGLSLIPRTAGTSLAGQCVGSGIVVDTSRYLNRILEVNAEEGWVRVQPGVVRDELNRFLKPHGLFFGPNTSTANRAMIGGMVGNNSCGSTSIQYGTTRDHVLELKTILSDGSEAVFHALSREAFEEKCKLPSLEGQLYRQVVEVLHKPENQTEIRAQYPKSGIHRRNTGYALDVLLDSNRFTRSGPDFNFCKLLAGSEGTLCLTSEIKLHCDPLPPPEAGLLCAQFASIEAAMHATVVAMQHKPQACELMDKVVMDCTKGQRMYEPYRFFLEGDPVAVLVIEFDREHKAEIDAAFDSLEADLKAAGLGYAFPRIFGPDINKVWDLRKAGLGLLANIPGDAKAVAVIEDTAVLVEELPAYIAEFSAIMEGFGQQAVYYAHAGAGELHLRPLLDLKTKEGRRLFREIATESAKLVKKYRGSLSGEHGDGRVRAEFIPLMIGAHNYALLKQTKATWDPKHIFNPGKIVDAPPMDTSLRYDEGQKTPEFDTLLNFDASGGILRLAEKCNGSGDCRKLPASGGSMCPSYMATRSEKDTTRARANILREFLTRSEKTNRFDHSEIKEVMDLCLSCKGCASECPSNVDMASLKAEFLHQYYRSNGVPLRARLFSNYARLNALGAKVPGLTNALLGGAGGALFKKVMKIAPQRSLPPLQKITLRAWYHKNRPDLRISGEKKGKVFLFCDEFTNYSDTPVGIAALRLLTSLGYEVDMVEHPESGRAAISKGLLLRARQMARANVAIFKDLVSAETPLLGIEPSAILGFRDEYPRLVDRSELPAAEQLAKHALMIDEFLAAEIKKGKISAQDFSREARLIKLHGHCHQKALASVDPTVAMLSIPENYRVEVIPSGCCGMAGSFGYEAEHYEVSQSVGELVLFPAVRAAGPEVLIAAPGTSCRHQILDGTGRKALHPVELLWQAAVVDTHHGAYQ